MKKTMSVILAILIIVCSLPVFAEIKDSIPFDVNAQSAVLIDTATWVTLETSLYIP